jgi:hypothetical protein
MCPPLPLFRRYCLLAASFFGLIRPALATQIIWDIPLYTNCVLSNNTSWPDAMVLELGSFASTFNPTPTNTANWAANWTPIQRTKWNGGGERFYSQELTMITNPAPFTAGASAWVWGIRGNEWILFRRTNWNWPTASPAPSGIIGWTADASVVTVVGSVQSGGGSFSLKTAAVASGSAPGLPYADWLDLWFTNAQQNNASLTGPDADFDRDGRANFLEYMGSSRPDVATSLPPNLMTSEVTVTGPTRYLSARLRFDSRCLFTATGQQSTTLSGWTNFTPLELSSGPGVKLYSGTQLTITSAAPRKQFRLRLAPAP